MKFFKVTKNEGMLKLAKLRQIFANEIGKIGLYWLSKDFDKVLSSNLQTLSDNVEGKIEIPKNLSVLKGHKKAWTEFSDSEISEFGGNPNAEGWRSLPRGFVAYNTEEESFYIVGGKWLNQTICDNIAKAFNLSDYKVMLFSDYDNIIWEDSW